MPKCSKKQAFLCSSADWNQVVEGDLTPDAAAAIALKKQIEIEPNNFSVAAVISVVPIEIDLTKMMHIYAPSVLADIGMHHHASEMIKQIDSSND